MYLQSISSLNELYGIFISYVLLRREENDKGH